MQLNVSLQNVYSFSGRVDEGATKEAGEINIHEMPTFCISAHRIRPGLCPLGPLNPPLCISVAKVTIL